MRNWRPPRGGKSLGWHVRWAAGLFSLLFLATSALSGCSALTGNVMGSPGATTAPAAPGGEGQPVTAAPGFTGREPLITEIMASNKGTIASLDGRYHDWIELYNPTDRDIDLAGFSLSDNLRKPIKSVLSSYVLKPGEYVLIIADGEASTDVELHVSFKLDSAGQTLLLVDPDGREVQRIAYPAMEAGQVYAADAPDIAKWALTDRPTPGLPNTPDGYDRFQATRVATSPIRIDEVMTGNTMIIKDSDGEYTDWLELYNPTDAEVDLTGWGLSNREDEPKRWTFPETKIAPGQRIVVFASGKNRAVAGQELHTSFRLDAFHDELLLSNFQGQIVGRVTVDDLKPDTSYALSADGKWQVATHPTPGYPNTEEGWRALETALFGDTDEPIILGEIMSANVSTLKDQFGVYPDWLELLNRSDRDVNLKGYGLSDRSDEPGRWKFPAVTLKAGQRLVVFASGRNLADDKAVSARKLHTDFKIGADGCTVVLTAPDGHMADRCLVAALKAGMSYGRAGDSMLYVYFDKPTPGQANTEGYPGRTADPVFSLKAGMYDDAKTVELTSEDSDAKIYYTLDGKPPTRSSKPYTGPISMPKTTVIRAVAYRDGYLPSDAVCSTYLIGEGIHIPVVSIVTDPDNLFNKETGIYANYEKNWEKPAHLELLETDGTVGLSQEMGLSMFGQFSRARPLKGFACIARTEYGSNSFDYKIFPDLPYTSYKSFVLRASGNDVGFSRIRDVLITSLVNETTELSVQAYRNVVLFVNGEFFGVTQIREKINDHYIAQHYDVDPDKIDLLEGTGSIIKAGSNKDFKDLMTYVKSHDLSKQANYDYVAARIDIDNYIDYIACEICSGNSDLGNIRFWKEQGPNGKWRWIYYDFCWGFFTLNREDIKYDLNPAGNGYNHAFSTALINGLLKNKAFKQKFLERLAYHIDVTFGTEKVLERIDMLAAEIEPYMEKDWDKWGFGTLAGWQKEVEKLREYARKHPALLKQQMQSYFHLTDTQMEELFQR